MLPPYIVLLGARGATRTRDPLLRKLRLCSSSLSKTSFMAIHCDLLHILAYTGGCFYPI